jgi:hypothetical protein
MSLCQVSWRQNVELNFFQDLREEPVAVEVAMERTEEETRLARVEKEKPAKIQKSRPAKKLPKILPKIEHIIEGIL